jgi:hypothetical protein
VEDELLGCHRRAGCREKGDSRPAQEEIERSGLRSRSGLDGTCSRLGENPEDDAKRNRNKAVAGPNRKPTLRRRGKTTRGSRPPSFSQGSPSEARPNSPCKEWSNNEEQEDLGRGRGG